MDRPEQDFENLLRHHLSSELDAMRGQSARAFEREVTRPMQRRLRRDFWNRHAARARHWGTIGLAMAACTAMGFFLPHFASHSSGGSNIATDTSSPQIVTPRYADYDRTTEWRHVDEGAAVLPNGDPGRLLRQQRVESLHYTNPATKEEDEWMVPSEQETIVPAHRQ